MTPSIAPPKRARTLDPSPHQRTILDAVRATPDNLLIQAAAGSGKTTTLRLVCEALPRTKRVLAVAFNRAIAQEFAKKLPRNVEAKTLHSVGLGIIRKARPSVTIDEYKFNRILDSYCNDHMRHKDKSKLNAWRAGVSKLVSVLYATCGDPYDKAALDDLCDTFEINLTREDFGPVPDIVAALRGEQDAVSFDDMIDHPLYHSYPFPQYDVVLVDEAQDLNLQQMEFLERFASAGARIICVGDARQAIYAFRGADHGAMAAIRARFKCRELPLSVCYRCGTSIIAEAQAVVGKDAIQAAPGAPEGMVLRFGAKDYANTLDKLESGDLVICRVNKHLVPGCFQLIRQGRKATIRGRDIGKGLTTIVNTHAKKTTVHSLASLVKAVTRWRDTRKRNLLAQGRTQQAQGLDDQVETLLAMAENVDSIQALRDAIQRVFSDQAEGVVFSSIHRAKGLEADCVVYLGPELIPHPMAKGEAAIRQEMNLDYVARTRAVHALIYQEVPKRK